jgi:lipoprotein-anchoring transpeptidase ErfK/SrfK
MKRILILALVVLGMLPAQAHAQDTILSNEVTITRWAYPMETARVRTQPSTSAATVTKLRFFTEDKLPEVYLVLRSRQVGQVEWMQVRLPMRPNGRTGWVPASALGDLQVNRTRLVIDRTSLRAKFYVRGQLKWSSVIGVGASRTPTPAGSFYIRERLTGFGGSYGPVAFGTSAYSSLSDWPGGGVIGIHGTDQPGLLPGRVSHGCIRVPNSKISQLDRMMRIGTPVTIV